MRRALDRLGCYDLGVDILVESQVGPVVSTCELNGHLNRNQRYTGCRAMAIC
jgi:hypothetical protein